MHCYLQARFSHCSQRALGKYLSLQVTLKTIAHTTALRHKDVNYFHGCFVIQVAVFPTSIYSTFGKVTKCYKAFDLLIFFFFLHLFVFVYFFLKFKADYNRHILLRESCIKKVVQCPPWVIEVMQRVFIKKL